MKVFPVAEFSTRMALLGDEHEDGLTGSDLSRAIARWAAEFKGSRGLVFLYIPNSVEAVAALLGAWQAGHAVALLNPELSTAVDHALINAYSPQWIVRPGQNGHLLLDRCEGVCLDVHPDLALLLSTSGSTGSPKFVRLSWNAILQNARAISQVLDIRLGEAGCAHLPLHYSYGFSVLTSHLISGAPVWVTNRTLTDRSFWMLARERSICHLPGVPFHFQIMNRMRFDRLDLPSLRVLTQAGGNLDYGIRLAAYEHMAARGGRFHVMYGQTEAAPRMSTLAHEEFLEAPTGVGSALPGGRFMVVDEKGLECSNGQVGTVLYFGPNVMMGYASDRRDLSLGDELEGRLETGDVGKIDDAGRLTLTGRTKRFGKVFGLRINLDEIESFTANVAGANAVLQRGDSIYIIRVVGDSPITDDALLAELAARYSIPRSVYRFSCRDTLPVTERGKTDYAVLESTL